MLSYCGEFIDGVIGSCLVLVSEKSVDIRVVFKFGSLCRIGAAVPYNSSPSSSSSSSLKLYSEVASYFMVLAVSDQVRPQWTHTADTAWGCALPDADVDISIEVGI